MAKKLELINALVDCIMTIAPDVDSVQKDITDLKNRHPNVSRDQLANWFANRSRRFYTVAGVASALPSVIPGLGTAAQVVVEGGTILCDLTYMIRHMARLSMGIGAIYGHDPKGFDTQEFMQLLGYWCGVLQPLGETIVRGAIKVANRMAGKYISREIIVKINQKVGITLVTKYGTKRGLVSLGRIIPLGIGAAFGGGFNYVTMTGFKKYAISFFRDNPELYFK